MNIAHLSASLSRMGGGVTEVKKRLTQNLLKAKDIDIEVFGLKDKGTGNDLESWEPLQPVAFDVVGPSALGFSPTLLSSLQRSKVDLIHLHGLWQFTSYAVAKTNKPHITTIHGMLEPWALRNSRFKKVLAAILYEKAALKKASCIQAITLQEYNDIRNFGLKNPVCVIPNGVDVPSNIDKLKASEPCWAGSIERGRKILLYLGRIHPKKGLTNLIKAWKLAYSSKISGVTDWDLVIAGWDQGGYESELKKLTIELNVSNTVHFIGPQFDYNKSLAYAHADAFILPSFSEGLPMAVLEAWAFNLPVIMTEHCNLPEGFDAKAAFCVAPSAEGVLEGLNFLFSSDKTMIEHMGTAGKQLVMEKFNWESVADQMYQVYNWILSGGAVPETVLNAKTPYRKYT